MCIQMWLMKRTKKNAKKGRTRKGKNKSTSTSSPCCSILGNCCQNVSSVMDKCPLLCSLLGFTFGMAFSLLWFYMMAKQMNYGLMTSVVVSITMGAIMTLGLAFSTAVRCVTLLVIPNMCSSNGRMLLLGYVLVLVMTHPVVNYKHNVHVMSDTVTCTQELAYNMTRQLVDAAGAPFGGILNDIQQVMNSLVAFSNRLEEAFDKVRALFVEVVASINSVFDWLGDMVTICNDKMGEPYRKCCAPLDRAYADCKDKMSFLGFTCEIITGIKAICNIARIGELLCKITEAIQNAVKVHITDKIKVAMKDVKEMFYFRVDLEYEYNVTLVQSKTFDEIRKDISAEVEKKLAPLSKVATLSNIILLILLFVTFIKAMLYRRGFLSKDRYDNYYLSENIRNLDQKRIGMGKPTILPLTVKENKKYIEPSSCRLVKAEKSKLAFGIIIYIGSLIHGSFFMMCDYGLYWLLQMIQREGQLEVKEEVPSHMKLHVQGDGVMADIYRSLITQFDPVDKVDYSLDTNTCLPKPSEPNWDVYKTIGTIYGICLILVVTEAYLLRLRHVIARCYYPERDKDRCIWLYSHILRKRGNVLKYLRRDVHNNQKNAKDAEGGIVSRFLAKCPMLEKLLAPLGFGYECCMGCGTARQQAPDNGMIHCDNYNCKAVYCEECYTDLNNMCTACMNPIDYGDFSDISEERDSSDEQEVPTMRKRAPV